MSKIVDTLDFEEPNPLKNDYHTNISHNNNNKVLTEDFLKELGLNNNTNKKAFDCDISALNATEIKPRYVMKQEEESRVEEDLVNQINSLNEKKNKNLELKEKFKKKAKNEDIKITTKIQNQHKKDQEKKEARRKKQSLREKFRLRIEHGKQIESNPSAFTSHSSDLTINQNNTLNQFNPHNPQNFENPRKLTEFEMLEQQEALLLQSINKLNQYKPQINRVENIVGVEKNYRHTKDFLNKKNSDYEIEETLGYYDEYQLENSLKNLDDLILRKKYNEEIPFVRNDKDFGHNQGYYDEDDEDYDIEKIEFLKNSNNFEEKKKNLIVLITIIMMKILMNCRMLRQRILTQTTKI